MKIENTGFVLHLAHPLLAKGILFYFVPTPLEPNGWGTRLVGASTAAMACHKGFPHIWEMHR